MTLTQRIDGLMGSSTNAAPRPRLDDSMFDVLSGIRLFHAYRGIFGSRRKAQPDTNRSASVAPQENPHAFPNPSHSRRRKSSAADALLLLGVAMAWYNVSSGWIAQLTIYPIYRHERLRSASLRPRRYSAAVGELPPAETGASSSAARLVQPHTN
jgi:hypothetical protein